MSAAAPPPAPQTSHSVDALRIEGLSFKRGDKTPLRGISLTLKRGEALALLGPRGAGKTLLAQLICGLLPPSSGEISIHGFSLQQQGRAARASLGYVPATLSFYPELTVQENLEFFGHLYLLKPEAMAQRLQTVLKLTGLLGRQEVQAQNLSLTLQRHLNLGVAIMHQPHLLLLDEPTLGMDGTGKRHLLDTLKSLRAQGTALLLLSAVPDEVREVADTIALIDRGSLLAQGFYHELLASLGDSARLSLTLEGRKDAVLETLERWRGLEGVTGVTLTEGTSPPHVEVLAPKPERLLGLLLDVARIKNVSVLSFQVHKPGLEALFLQLTGHPLTELASAPAEQV
ncbi:MAG: ABC transporter ATP-binding protein [Myxococcota bacterium]